MPRDGWRRRAAEVSKAEGFVDFTIAEMKAAGEPAHLTYWARRTVDEGDVIQTTTGRRYLVTSSRRTEGRDPHWVLETIVMASDDPNPTGAAVHELFWSPRSRRRSP